MTSKPVESDIKLLRDAFKKIQKTQNFLKFNQSALLHSISVEISKLEDYNERLKLSDIN